jgi:hypothetical protein
MSSLTSAALAFVVVLLILIFPHKVYGNEYQESCSRRCGVHNISYPFRLKDSPKKCGDNILVLTSVLWCIMDLNFLGSTVFVKMDGMSSSINISRLTVHVQVSSEYRNFVGFLSVGLAIRLTIKVKYLFRMFLQDTCVFGLWWLDIIRLT